VGRFLARALLDRRIPNLRLSRPLVKLLRGDSVSFDQLSRVSEPLYVVLRAMFQANITGSREMQLQKLVKPEDLGLTFVLPGEEEIELIPNGADVPVTRDNMVEYINLVSEYFLKKGIEPIIREIRAGLHETVPLYALKILTADEIQSMLDGHQPPVSLPELEAFVNVDHGYTASSPQVRYFFEILSELDIDHQRRFFQFLTGSPYLPVGGLGNLKPRMTVVRKTSTDPKIVEQDQLPSAMTCQHYLKLPAYDSKDMMRAKLLQAIEEGCGVFLFT
jgi:E3 ubiquitin-protein ligase TRIP12